MSEKSRERERRILDFMKKTIKHKGYPPTVREICEACEIKSTSTVHKDIESLVSQGLLVKDPAKPRALVVQDSEMEDRLARPDVIDIPVIGRIAAGTPILAEQNIEDSFPLPARFMGNGNNFLLNVKGESMIEAGILDGDYILVEQTQDARNGEIVVARIDGFESEATVKTYYNEGDHVRLQPENSSMSPIIVNDVKILGRVKGVFRYF
ncbi:MAG: transcriptional repressor LexA [Anaerovoracaceae bacterium]|nr:transcriptional repressor LexA [Anaerovoracaceae bacterium]